MSQALVTSVTYTLSMPKPSTHYFEVQVNFTGVVDEYIDLVLPVWRPGRYIVFDFASGVQDFKAFDDSGSKLDFKKIDKSTWRVTTGLKSSRKGSIIISYRVYANEFDLRTRGLDEYHGFVNGTAVFMYSERFRQVPLTLKVLPYPDWHVTTGLENLNENPLEFTAAGYDHLADCPLEIGNQKDYYFEVQGREHVISFYGEADYNIERMKADFSEIIKKNYEFWGSVPYGRYVFIIHCTPHGGGGTEHINSTVIGIKPSDLENGNSYRNFLRLVSHEFFHTWNVKQLRPKGITPYDYTKENYTEELWIAEGGTSYYDGLILSRTGHYSTEDIFSEIARAVEENRRRPGNRVQSLAESSFDAWIKFWKRNRQSYNAETDYYKKGADVSLVLDLELRFRSANRSSLDDVFKTMFERFPLGVSGYTNEDFMNVCSELGSVSFKQFFDNYVYGTKPIEWEKFLSYAGLELRSKDSTVLPVVGISLSGFRDRVFISNVTPSSSAEDAGLSADDEIIAIDGLRAEYKTVEKRLNEMKANELVKLTVFKQNKLSDVILRLKDRKIANYYVQKTAAPDALQKSIFESWLGKKW